MKPYGSLIPVTDDPQGRLLTHLSRAIPSCPIQDAPLTSPARIVFVMEGWTKWRL